ncbi:MAG: LapA family protein [Desulfobacterales bacterium]|jgi:uncharacterized integral membrane protein|nr:LapA family protein [Desulfobacterales bacterium]
MREFKTTFWVILLFLAVVFIYQNQNFFFQANQSFRINLIFTEYKSPEIPSALIFISCIFIGFFVAYLLSIPGRMTSRKKIKLLQKAVDSQLKEISSLNNKLNELNVGPMKTVSENTEKSHSDYR